MQYMVQQHDRWVSHVRDTLRQEVPPEEVVLIGGWIKTSADWAASVFSNLVTKQSASLQVKAGHFLGFGLSGSRARAQSGPKLHRQGAKYPRGKGKGKGKGRSSALEKNQSIFLKRYKLKKRLHFIKTIVARAGYDRLPDLDPGGDAQEGLISDTTIQDVDDTDDIGLTLWPEAVSVAHL